MPQASNSRIPLAENEYDLPHQRKGLDQNDAKPSLGANCSGAQASSPHRLGVFPFSWGWQLAGLIAAMITGLLLVVGYFQCQAPAFLLLAGLGILGLSIYSAVKTNWLREVSAKALPIKIGAGTVVICGLVPIGVGLASLAIGGAICAVVFGALGALGGK